MAELFCLLQILKMSAQNRIFLGDGEVLFGYFHCFRRCYLISGKKSHWGRVRKKYNVTNFFKNINAFTAKPDSLIHFFLFK